MIGLICLLVKKRGFFVAVTLLFLVIVVFVGAPSVYAQLVCPASWTNDPNTLSDDPIVPAEGRGSEVWYDFTNPSFSYNVELTPPFSDDMDGAVSNSGNRDKGATINVSTNASTAIFSRIYANFHSILTPFLTVSDSRASRGLSAELRQRWHENYCISGLSPMNGEFRFEIEAQKTYLRTRSLGVRYCYTPPDGVEVCGDTCPAGRTCRESEDFGTEQVTDAPERLQARDSVMVPYVLSLRDIARKVAYSIKEQYCNVDADCLNDSYVCAQENTFALGYGLVQINRGDPAAKNKKGVCVFSADVLEVPDDERRMWNMCTVIDSAVSVGRLNSRICHYPLLSYVTGPRPDYLRVNMRIDNSEQNRNELPFDTDLFANRGQSANPACSENSKDVGDCELDGYYRSALHNKLSLFNEADREAFQKMKFSIGVGIGVETDPDMDYGAFGWPDAWSFDYVERLGGIAMLSEEARFMNSNLLPAGDRVIAEHGRQVYVRGGQVFFDNEVISNRQLLDENGNPIATSAAVANFEVLVTAQESLRSAIRNVLEGGSTVEVFEGLYNALRNGLGSETAKNVLDAYRLVLRAPLDVPRCSAPSDDISEVECLNINANYTAQFNSRYRAYLRLYEPFREEAQTLSKVSSPTIHYQSSRGEYLVTFTRNEEVFYGIAKQWGRIEAMRRVPGSQNTFVQIPYRAFLNSQGEIVLVTSDVSGGGGGTYKVIHYRPGETISQVLSSDLGLTGLRHVASYLDRQDNLHIASFSSELRENPQTIRYIRLSTVGGLQVTYDTDRTGFEIRYVDSSSNRSPRFFAYRWRPGLAVAADRRGRVHIVASGSFEPFAFVADLFHFHFDPDRGSFVSSPKVVTDQENDKSRGFIPNVQEAYTSRLLSPSAASLELVGPAEIPTVVWVNRISFLPGSERASETWTQAMVATWSGVLRTWNVHPLSSATEFLRTEISYPFVSEIGEMGVTVNDRVSKKNVVEGWFDAYGYKRCVFKPFQYWELISGGSTACGSIRDMMYIQPNGGSWRLEKPTVLQ